MKSIKLSECNEESQIFLYDGETVGLQYILGKIYNGNKLPKIELCENDEAFNNAISNVLKQMETDIKNGVEREEYELNNLKTTPVEIDITKKDIKKINSNIFKIKSC